MPNPDGSPTLQEILAANPGMSPGNGNVGMGSPMPPPSALPAPPPMLAAPTPDTNNYGNDSLKNALTGAGINVPGVGGSNPGIGSGGNTSPPPAYAEKVSPLQMQVAGMNLPPGIGPGALPPAPAHSGMGASPIEGASGAAGGKGGINYSPTGTGATANTAPPGTGNGFFIPAGAGKGGAGTAAAMFNPVKNQLAASANAQQGAEGIRQLEHSDTQFQGEMLNKDASTVDAMRVANETQAARAKERVDGARNTYESLLAQAPHESIDSDRFFKNRSTGKAIGQTLAAMFAGFAAGFNGQQGNFVLDKINKEVERDIEEQRANIAGRKEEHANQVQGAKTVYEMMRQSTGDDRAAADYTKALVLDKMAIEGKQRALLSQDVGVQKEWQAQQNALEMHSAALKDQAAAATWKAQHAGTGFDRNKFATLVTSFVEKGDDQATAETRAARIMGVSAGGGNLGTLENAPGGAHVKQAELEHGVGESNKNFDRYKNDPALKGGLGTSIAAKFGQYLAPDSTKQSQHIDQIGASMLGEIGKYARDADGKPNVEMIDEFRHSFLPQIGLSEELNRARVEAGNNYINSLARVEGARNTREPNSMNLADQIRGAKKVGE